MNDNHTAGKLAFLAFCAAAGGTHSPYDELTDAARRGWEAAGRSCGLGFKIGDTVHDCHANVTGTVQTVQRSRGDLNGYWLNCIDSTGRPFDHYVREQDAASGPHAATK